MGVGDEDGRLTLDHKVSEDVKICMGALHLGRRIGSFGVFLGLVVVVVVVLVTS